MSLGRGSVMTLRSHWRMTPRALRSAPFEARNLTISAWLCAAAHISADCPPQSSLALTSAPRFQQPPGRFDLAAAGDGHQRRFAFRIPRVGIGAGLEQRVDDRRRADDGRLGQRRRAELVLQLDVRAGLDQRAHQLEIVVRRGPHDRRRAVRPGRIRIGALRQQAQRGRAIAALGRVEQRRSRRPSRSRSRRSTPRRRRPAT